MDSEQEHGFSSALIDHPIFSWPHIATDLSSSSSLELSHSSLPKFTNVTPLDDSFSPTGRRKVMVFKDTDLILAIGKEIRMATISDPVTSRNVRRNYKELYTPNIQYEIHEISLNPSGKLLAVAGAFQLSVIVMPRAGYSRLVPQKLDCKSIQIGQYYHATNSSPPIVKIAWHPLGGAGTTLLVMTADGKMREYDISVDTEEPQQVLSFVPERKVNTRSFFTAEDPSEREIASFTLGNGAADWGPLTIYAIMKSGDVYAMCPYMPKNSSISSAYIHSLECFISAKQEFLAQGTSAEAKRLHTLYDYQRKYVTALVKQLPPGTGFPTASRSVLMHPPDTIKAMPVRQGPFLLQPAPRMLENSPGGDATDICYLAFGSEESEEGEGETESLGVVAITYQDGKIDLCLDVEKVEARWEQKHGPSPELPMLAVYETIDLGLVETLREIQVLPGQPPLLDLLQANYPVLVPDPIHDDALYVYHAFGVHALQLRSLQCSISAALHAEEEDQFSALKTALQKNVGASVVPIVTTFSVERRCSNPIIAVAIPNDIYLTYSIVILTSLLRVSCFPLHLASSSPQLNHKNLPPIEASKDKVTNVSPSYVSLLEVAPFSPPAALIRPLGLPNNAKISVGPSALSKAEFLLTPDTLRYLAKTIEKIISQIHEIQLAYRDSNARVSLQVAEARRLQERLADLKGRIGKLDTSWKDETESKIKRMQEDQKAILTRTGRILHALMEKASPGLSEYETIWFNELKQIKNDVVGQGKYDDASMVSRTVALEKEFARLLPSLQALRTKQLEHREKLDETTQSIGASQAFDIGQRSSAERARIAKLEESLINMASKLQISIGKPPSQV